MKSKPPAPARYRQIHGGLEFAQLETIQPDGAVVIHYQISRQRVREATWHAELAKATSADAEGGIEERGGS